MQGALHQVFNNITPQIRCLIDFFIKQAIEQNNVGILNELCQVMATFNPVFAYRDAAYKDRVTLELMCYDKAKVDYILAAEKENGSVKNVLNNNYPAQVSPTS